MISAEAELARHLRGMYDQQEWEWMENARCARLPANPEMFFADRGKFSTPQVKEAIRICRECPVITQCLEWALKTHDAYGVLGGMTPPQRTKLRRDREYAKVMRDLKAERAAKARTHG